MRETCVIEYIETSREHFIELPRCKYGRFNIVDFYWNIDNWIHFDDFNKVDHINLTKSL